MQVAVDLGNLGDFLTGIGTLVIAAAAVPALLGFRRARRAEAAERLNGIFREFYIEERLQPSRLMLEYGFATLAPLLERRITNRSQPASHDEQKQLEQIDTLLKYLEFILHLQSKGLLKQRDRMVVLNYWFELLRAPERAALRRYVDFFGWYRLAYQLNTGQRRDPQESRHAALRHHLNDHGWLRLIDAFSLW